MKASIKFREEQKPLTRAKIPLSILGFPFQSGVVCGDPKELALTLATSFESGPSIQLAYRPNDPINPFGFVFKTGIGRFGCPDTSPVTMSAEFSLIGSHNPRFFVRFSPRVGDFSIKKSQSSDFVKKGFNVDDSIEVVESPETGNQAAVTARMLCGLLRGTEASARTSLPVMRRAVVNFRWGFRVPPEGGIGIAKLPVLVMNKIGIEHVAEDKEVDVRGSDDVEETWSGLKRQMEMIQCENGMMKKAMDELRYEVAAAGCGGERKRLNEERDGKEDPKKAM